MKITEEKVLTFQNTNYNFTSDRLKHIDLERLKFELGRFHVLKEKISNTAKVNVEIDYGDNHHSFNISIEQMVIGAMEQMLRKILQIMGALDNNCHLHSVSSFYRDEGMYIHSIFMALEQRLDRNHLLLCPSYFENVSHEYIYHKNKTQKAFYEVYYTDLCNQFENFLKYMENFDTSIINLYFDMCDNFFVKKYADIKN